VIAALQEQKAKEGQCQKDYPVFLQKNHLDSRSDVHIIDALIIPLCFVMKSIKNGVLA